MLRPGRPGRPGAALRGALCLLHGLHAEPGFLFTGRPLPAHGLIDNGIPLDDRRLTLPQALSRAGYETYAVGKVHLTPYLADADSGLADGELYDLAADPDEQENLFHRPEHRATRDALLADLCRAYVEAGPLESPARLPWQDRSRISIARVRGPVPRQSGRRRG
ncbi:MAG: sulfatase-like hydrolase/transferase [Armatimonadetes bacterium]|nr:sulfatase-like hydrolase/transferase [Armatimonadota bacterium]